MKGLNLINIIEKYSEIIGLPEESMCDVYSVIDIICKNDDLVRIKDEAVSKTWDNVNKDSMPGTLFEVKKINENIVPMFPVICLIQMAPELIELYNKYKIDLSIAKDTLSDLSIWMNDYYAKNKQWGIAEFHFISLSFGFRLFKLGRLQFIRIRNKLNCHVYKNNSTGKLIIMAKKGLVYSENRWTERVNSDLVSSIVSEFVTDQKENTLRGIDFGDSSEPPGEVEINMNQWSQVLGPESYVLDTHIQAGQPLTGANTLSSLKQAKAFWINTFPDEKFEAFTCDSWLLGKDLDKLLPESSGIMGFWSMFNRIPIPDSTDNQIWERVFGLKQKPVDLSALCVDTSLQRALLESVKKGIVVKNQNGFILKDEI